jgi:hypothetical protein
MFVVPHTLAENQLHRRVLSGYNLGNVVRYYGYFLWVLLSEWCDGLLKQTVATSFDILLSSPPYNSKTLLRLSGLFHIATIRSRFWPGGRLCWLSIVVVAIIPSRTMFWLWSRSIASFQVLPNQQFSHLPTRSYSRCNLESIATWLHGRWKQRLRKHVTATKHMSATIKTLLETVLSIRSVPRL